jgi:hypothetical protein
MLYSQLGELLPVFEYILTHFEGLEEQIKTGNFHGYPGIARLITEVWNKAKDYYSKTDQSVAWMASTVINPRFKIKYFEDKWTGSESHVLYTTKPKVKKLWEDIYKCENVIIWPPLPPSVTPPVNYLTDLMNRVPPQLVTLTRISSRKDQYTQYLEEPVSHIPIIQYWQLKEPEWPQLASMAFDLLAVPAMSSEYERVFSSCTKQTIPESSRLTGRLL